MSKDGTSPFDFLNINTEYVSKDVAMKRLKICESCPKLKIRFCQECNCFMPAKTRLKKAECPLNEW